MNISTLGLYVAEINGQRVGDQVLTPGWTSFQHRVQYQQGDVGSSRLSSHAKKLRRSHPLRSWSLLREIQYWTWGRIWWGEVTKEMVTGVVVHSDMDKRGTFSCNNDLINQLQHNIKEGYRLHCIFLQKG